MERFKLSDLHNLLKSIHPDLMTRACKQGYRFFSKHNKQLNEHLKNADKVRTYFYWEVPLCDWKWKAKNSIKFFNQP